MFPFTRRVKIRVLWETYWFFVLALTWRCLGSNWISWFRMILQDSTHIWTSTNVTNLTFLYYATLIFKTNPTIFLFPSTIAIKLLLQLFLKSIYSWFLSLFLLLIPSWFDFLLVALNKPIIPIKFNRKVADLMINWAIVHFYICFLVTQTFIFNNTRFRIKNILARKLNLSWVRLSLIF